jgi:hypothetical protein
VRPNDGQAPGFGAGTISMRTIVSLAAGVMSLTSISPAGSAELIRRAQTLEERFGRVELRRAYGTRLEVVVDCEANKRGCVEERAYDEVLRIDFHLGKQEVAGNSVVSIEDPVDTIYLATHFRDEDRETFREELEQALRSLSADAFDEPFAGLEPMKAPFDKPTLSTRSVLPSWACFESGGKTSMTVRFHRHMDGNRLLGTGAKRYAQPPTAVCNEIRAATESAYPDVFWTLASPRLLLEQVVEHHDELALDTSDPRSLLERPRGVQLVKQEMPGGGSPESTWRAADGSLSRATHGAHGSRFDAWAEPTAIPISALDENAWLHAWTISTVERELGARPAEQVVARTTILAAYLATVPAGRLTQVAPDGSYPLSESGHLEIEVVQPASETPARINRTAFLDRLVEELESQGDAPEERLASWLSRPAVGLESEGWLVVVCRDDGTASYSVPPTKAANRVTNADLFCAALEARLF